MKKTTLTLFVLLVLSLTVSFVSCSGGVKGENGYYAPAEPGDSAAEDGGTGEPSTNEKPVETVLPSGMITASAWNDNDNYRDWQDLFWQGQNKEVLGKYYQYTFPENSWGFNSTNRVKVTVKNGETLVAGAKASIINEQGEAVFTAVSDSKGNAYLFTDMPSGSISISSGESTATALFTETEREISVELQSNAEKLNVIEIMFVVDVTGSMGDEISFLKAELSDVINRIASENSGSQIKLALLFYRDNTDRVPFDYYDFTDVTVPDGMTLMQNALNKQYADGGGDYPEAVDEALDMAVNKQWSTGATTKIIYHVLDAPAHDNEKSVKMFNSAAKKAAEKGIRICPIICSGSAELTEYTMREAAIYTGGTFIFVTDDSGIGGEHHDPGLPNATVELLNSLLVRLTNGYHTGDFAPPVFWRDDPNLNNSVQ